MRAQHLSFWRLMTTSVSGSSPDQGSSSAANCQLKSTASKLLIPSNTYVHTHTCVNTHACEHARAHDCPAQEHCMHCLDTAWEPGLPMRLCRYGDLYVFVWRVGAVQCPCAGVQVQQECGVQCATLGAITRCHFVVPTAPSYFVRAQLQFPSYLCRAGRACISTIDGFP